ncbi:Glutamate receptor ionotropic, kainate 5, partial [Lamellibrachia satsuma]
LMPITPDVALGGSSQPRTLPVRAFIGCWWAFCIVIVTTYGGSLIAFLTISKTVAPFCSLEEMVEQSAYRWGTNKDSVYASTFSTARRGIYSKLWAGIQRFSADDPSVLSQDEHVQFEKVKRGGYAYIMDRTPLTTYSLLDSNCTVVVLGCHFMQLPFGIGLQKGSPYRSLLLTSVRRLQQSGMLTMWRNKWWPPEACSGIDVPEAAAVTLPHTQSAFYLLFAGVVAAYIALAAERCRSYNAVGLLWKAWKKN